MRVRLRVLDALVKESTSFQGFFFLENLRALPMYYAAFIRIRVRVEQQIPELLNYKYIAAGIIRVG